MQQMQSIPDELGRRIGNTNQTVYTPAPPTVPRPTIPPSRMPRTIKPQVSMQGVSIVQSTNRDKSSINVLPPDIVDILQNQVLKVPQQNIKDFMNSKALSLVSKDMYNRLRTKYSHLYINLKLDKLVKEIKYSIDGLKDGVNDTVLSQLSGIYSSIEKLKELAWQVMKHKIPINTDTIDNAYGVLSEFDGIDGLLDNMLQAGRDYHYDNTNSNTNSITNINTNSITNINTNSIEGYNNGNQEEGDNDEYENAYNVAYNEANDLIKEINILQNKAEKVLSKTMQESGSFTAAKVAFLAEFLVNVKQIIDIEQDENKRSAILITYTIDAYPLHAVVLRNKKRTCLTKNIIPTKPGNKTYLKEFEIKVTDENTNLKENLNMNVCLNLHPYAHRTTIQAEKEKVKSVIDAQFIDIFYQNFEYIENISIVNKKGVSQPIRETINKLDNIIKEFETLEDIQKYFQKLVKARKLTRK
jgi:hypothetical protein